MKMCKRILSIFLALLVIISLVPSVIVETSATSFRQRPVELKKTGYTRNTEINSDTSINHAIQTPEMSPKSLTENVDYSAILDNYINVADEFNYFTFTANNYLDSLEIINATISEETVTQSFVNDMRNNVPFEISYNAWKIAKIISNPYEIVENKINEKTYYETIIFSLLKSSMESENAIDKMTQSSVKNHIKLMKSFTDYFQANYHEWVSNSCDISTLTEVQKSNMTSWTESYIATKWYSVAGKDLSFISTLLDMSSDIEEYSEKLAVYLHLTEVTDSTLMLIDKLIDNNDDEMLEVVLNEVRAVCSDSFSEFLTTAALEGTLTIANVALKTYIGKLWQTTVTTLSAGILSNGMIIANGVLIGIAIGKTLSNLCFSTDTKLDKFLAMECLVEFEDLLRDTLNNIMYEYNGSEVSAQVFIDSIEMLYSTYILDASYYKEMVNISKNAWITTMSDEEYEECISYADSLISQFNTEYDSINPSIGKCGKNLFWIYFNGTLIVFGFGDIGVVSLK